MKALIVNLLIMLALSGCREGEGSGHPVSSSGNSDAGLFTSSPASASVIQMYREREHDQRGTRERKVIQAFFRNGDSAFDVSAGRLTINGIEIMPRVYSNTTPPTVVYFHHSLKGQPVPLSFDGTHHVVETTGSQGFPAIRDSLPAPSGDVMVAFPGSADTVSKSEGFTVSWTQSTAPVGGVVVMINDTSAAAGTKGYIRKIPSDPGRVLIAPSDLATIRPGPLTIRVARGNFKSGTASDGRRYDIVAYDKEIIHTFMGP